MNKKTNKELALEAAKSTGCTTIFVNSKQECFTSKNLAGNSDKADKIETFEFTQAELSGEEAKEPTAKKPSKKEADGIVKAIAEAVDVAAVEAAVEGFELNEELQQLVDKQKASFAQAQ